MRLYLMEKGCPRCPQNSFGAYKWRSDAIYNGDKPGTNWGQTKNDCPQNWLK